MLKELKKKQSPDGSKQRWFFCHDLDIVFWLGEGDAPYGFQLAYDKYRGEKSISWHQDKGYKHYVVNDGETGIMHKGTPFLFESKGFDCAKVLALFEANVGEVPQAFAALVSEKLHAYHPQEAG